jgi:hypothetical protein
LLDEEFGELLDCFLLGQLQVRFRVLRIGREKPDRHSIVVKEVDHSAPASLAAALRGPTQLPNSAGILNQDAGRGVVGELPLEFAQFFVGQER